MFDYHGHLYVAQEARKPDTDGVVFQLQANRACTVAVTCLTDLRICINVLLLTVMTSPVSVLSLFTGQKYNKD